MEPDRSQPTSGQKKRKKGITVLIFGLSVVTLTLIGVLAWYIFFSDPTPIPAKTVSSTSGEKSPDKDQPDVEDKPVEEEREKQPENEGAVATKPLVTDAFFDGSLRSSGGGIIAIPQINLPGDEIRRINQQIFDTYYTNLAEQWLEDRSSMLHEESITYQWGQSNDILSVLIKHYIPIDYGMTGYDVYNVRISDGKAVVDTEVLSNSIVVNYRQNLKKALEACFWENFEPSLSHSGNIPAFNQNLRETRSESNIDLAKPFFNSTGQLCAVAKIYNMAVAPGWVILNLEDYNYQTKYAGEAAESSIKISTEDYYIYDSDERLITESDLYGLSENDCWLVLDEIYARHGRKFTDPEIVNYFNSKSWYSGTVDGSYFDNHLDLYLNTVEKQNIETIISYMRKKGWRS